MKKYLIEFYDQEPDGKILVSDEKYSITNTGKKYSKKLNETIINHDLATEMIELAFENGFDVAKDELESRLSDCDK